MAIRPRSVSQRMMYRILITEPLDQAGLVCLEEAPDIQFDVRTNLTQADLLALIPEYDALIVRSGSSIDAGIINAGKKLQVIGRAGMGTDNIDIRAATMAGIVVMNTPGANSIATAELTMTLLLAANRQTVAAHTSMAAGKWQRSDFVSRELFGMTLGLIGFGRVGRLVAERARAFGMEVLACDPFVSEEIGRDYQVTLVDLEDLLLEADIISLHTVLRPQTENLINRETIAQMKDGVILVNTARGRIIDDQALAEALESGKVKIAALDVYRQEPPTADNPLIGLPNVLHTPHIGAGTLEAQKVVATQIANQVISALRGLDFPNSINMPLQFNQGEYPAIKPFMDLAERIGRLHAGLANGPISKIEIDVRGEQVNELVRAIAAAILKGLLSEQVDYPLNYINAPVIADEKGIAIDRTDKINGLDYPNLITCRAYWEGGDRTLAGVLFGGSEPRIVQVDQYHLEAKPDGVVLIMQNRDVPGVIGQVGTILAAFQVNIGEWRLGRNEPGGEALSFINLDSVPSATTLESLAGIHGVTAVKLVVL